MSPRRSGNWRADKKKKKPAVLKIYIEIPYLHSQHPVADGSDLKWPQI